MKLDVTTFEAKKAGSIDLNDAIFGLDPRADILHRVVQWQLNKRQQGTHQAKSRGEINRTTAKLGKQKGGGTARHGSPKSGIVVGGGKPFGPRFRRHPNAHRWPILSPRLSVTGPQCPRRSAPPMASCRRSGCELAEPHQSQRLRAASRDQ